MTQLSVREIAAFAAGGSVLMGAFFGGVVSVITAWRTMVGKVTAIEAHVNSEKTAGEGREATLKRENELLREMLVDRKLTASLLAQAAASRARAEPVPVVVPARVLDRIEANTAATAEAVQNL